MWGCWRGLKQNIQDPGSEGMHPLRSLTHAPALHTCFLPFDRLPVPLRAGRRRADLRQRLGQGGALGLVRPHGREDPTQLRGHLLRGRKARIRTCVKCAMSDLTTSEQGLMQGEGRPTPIPTLSPTHYSSTPTCFFRSGSVATRTRVSIALRLCAPTSDTSLASPCGKAGR